MCTSLNPAVSAPVVMSVLTQRQMEVLLMSSTVFHRHLYDGKIFGLHFSVITV